MDISAAVITFFGGQLTYGYVEEAQREVLVNQVHVLAESAPSSVNASSISARVQGEHLPVQRDSIVGAGEEVKGGPRDGGEQHLVQPITRLGNSNHHKIAILR